MRRALLLKRLVKEHLNVGLIRQSLGGSEFLGGFQVGDG
jgi:hypothetical protein